MQRIAIVGATGAGKTYLAQQLAYRLQLPAVDLDELHWGPELAVVETALLSGTRGSASRPKHGGLWAATTVWRGI